MVADTLQQAIGGCQVARRIVDALGARRSAQAADDRKRGVDMCRCLSQPFAFTDPAVRCPQCTKILENPSPPFACDRNLRQIRKVAAQSCLRQNKQSRQLSDQGTQPIKDVSGSNPIGDCAIIEGVCG